MGEHKHRNYVIMFRSHKGVWSVTDVIGNKEDAIEIAGALQHEEEYPQPRVFLYGIREDNTDIDRIDIS